MKVPGAIRRLRVVVAALGLILWFSAPGLVAGQQLLVGYGNYPYWPFCAESCVQALKTYLLACSRTGIADGPLALPTLPDCYAQDEAFLTSSAWCISTKCAGEAVPITISQLENFWEYRVTGKKSAVPKWTYSAALANVDPRPPTYQLTLADKRLNRTSLVVNSSYQALWNAFSALTEEQAKGSTYSIALVVVALGLPILLSLLKYLPLLHRVVDWIKPYVVYPSFLGTYQVRPLPFLLGNAPTVGQAVYLAVLVVLNVVFTAVDYRIRQPNAVWGTEFREVCTYILLRTGAYAFVLLPVLILFSSRNNILLYLTDWSHSTYLLLHRWVARLFMVHVVIHSILGLQAFKAFENTSWYIWGIVGTVTTVALTVGSGLYIRRPVYEFFLASHVVLAVITIAGSWYHVIQWYAYLGRFIPDTLSWEIWLYFACSVWFFDRLVRVLRVLRNGIHRSRITDLGAGYIRVDIPGVRWGAEPGKHTFVYFPGVIPWRPWENHPFSVVPTCLLDGVNLLSDTHTTTTAHANGEGNEVDPNGKISDEEKFPATKTAITALPTTTQTGSNSEKGRGGGSGIGITLLIKKSTGMTHHLSPPPGSHPEGNTGLLTLLDGPYASTASPSQVLRCDRVLVISGGIGITGALPWVYSHWNVKLAWSVSEAARGLVEAVNLNQSPDVERLSGRGSKEVKVKVGERFNVEELVKEEEEAGWKRVGVVVCGPGGMCDDVRAAVVKVGRRGRTVFELEVDAFSW